MDPYEPCRARCGIAVFGPGEGGDFVEVTHRSRPARHEEEDAINVAEHLYNERVVVPRPDDECVEPRFFGGGLSPQCA